MAAMNVTIFKNSFFRQLGFTLDHVQMGKHIFSDDRQWLTQWKHRKMWSCCKVILIRHLITDCQSVYLEKNKSILMNI